MPSRFYLINLLAVIKQSARTQYFSTNVMSCRKRNISQRYLASQKPQRRPSLAVTANVEMIN